jgi:hypothetical protein
MKKQTRTESSPERYQSLSSLSTQKLARKQPKEDYGLDTLIVENRGAVTVGSIIESVCNLNGELRELLRFIL